MKETETKYQEVITANDSLRSKLKTADAAVMNSQESNGILTQKLEAKDKEVAKLIINKKEVETKLKVQKSDHAMVVKDSDEQIKSLMKTIKAKDKEF